MCFCVSVVGRFRLHMTASGYRLSPKQVLLRLALPIKCFLHSSWLGLSAFDGISEVGRFMPDALFGFIELKSCITLNLHI